MLSDIDRLCAEKKISYSQLAKECGVSLGYISLIRQGKRKNISYNVLESIARALDITVAELVNDAPCSCRPADLESVSGVLMAWGVKPHHQNELTDFLSDLDDTTQEPVLKFFQAYEAVLLKDMLEAPYSLRQINVLLTAALQDGRVEGWLTCELLDGREPVPIQLLAPQADSACYCLKVQPKHILHHYSHLLPDLLDELLNIFQSSLGKTEAYQYIGNLCNQNNLNDLAVIYFGDGILCAHIEEKRASQHNLIEMVRRLPSSQLKEIILAWYDGMILCTTEGRYDEALALHANVLDIPPYSETAKHFKARLYSNRGIIFTIQGRYKESISNYRESLRLCPDGPTSAASHVNMGLLMRRLGRLNEARKHFNLALDTKNAHTSSTALQALALISLDTKNYTEARRLILQGYLVDKKAHLQQGKTTAYINLGVYHREMGNYRHSLRLLDLGFKRAIRMKEYRDACFALLEMADTYIRTKHFEKAQTLIDKLPEFMVGKNDVLMLAFWLNNKASLYLAQRQTSIALTFLKQIYPMLREKAHVSYEYGNCLSLMKQAYINLREPLQAQFFQQELERHRKDSKF